MKSLIETDKMLRGLCLSLLRDYNFDQYFEHSIKAIDYWKNKIAKGEQV